MGRIEKRHEKEIAKLALLTAKLTLATAVLNPPAKLIEWLKG